jgi:hypothetical protein
VTRVHLKISLIMSLFVLITASNLFAFNPIEIARSIGCSSRTEIDAVKLAVPVYDYQEKEVLDPRTYEAVEDIYSKIKDVDRDNYQPKNIEAMHYAASLVDLRYRCEQYFEMHKKLTERRKKEQSKIDIYSFLKELNMPADYQSLHEFAETFEHYSIDDVRDQKKCQMINTFLNAIEDKRASDFKRLDQEQKDLVNLALGMEYSLGYFVRACDNVAEQDKEIEIAEKNASSDLVQAFSGTAKSGSFDLYKQMISYLETWKVTASKPYNETYWNLSSKDSKSDDHEIIFRNPPLDAGMHEDQYFFLKAQISRKVDGMFVLEAGSSEWEALADIPKSLIKKAKAKFNHDFYFVAKLIDVLDVTTIAGSTKPVCSIKVVAMANGDEYYEFLEYVAGHPTEFPSDKYVEVSITK